ncbi:zinc-binding dehydrogenase [Biscogniauxia marginata]|nr:zinc-binding dehydrogenase [Biscogniauxia marginata]
MDTSLSALPHSQCALVQNSVGEPVLAYDVAIPELHPNTILVKTVAVAINPADYKMGSRFTTPGVIIGADFAGEIVRLDAKAAELRPDLSVGDLVCGLVFGSNPAEPDNGAFAEYLRAHAAFVHKVPKHMDPKEAAALGVGLATAALSLWHALKLPGTIEKPIAAADTPVYVLVFGASTASGTMALQLLKLSGFTSIAICSPKNFTLVKSYGASHVFDYNDENLVEHVQRLTANKLEYALDCITDSFSVATCYAAMARTGGRYVSLELCPADIRPKRRAIQHDWVFAAEVFGKSISLGQGYERPASPELYQFAVYWYKVFQGLINEKKIRSHPLRVLGSGLENIKDGIHLLKTGSISGEKLVALLK